MKCEQVLSDRHRLAEYDGGAEKENMLYQAQQMRIKIFAKLESRDPGKCYSPAIQTRLGEGFTQPSYKVN